MKLSRCGSVSGAPCETAMEDSMYVWGRGGLVARTRWLWWWGRAFTKREVGRGFGSNKPKPSYSGSVLGCNGAAGGGEGCCGATAPPAVLT